VKYNPEPSLESRQQGGLTFKFDKFSANLQGFIFHLGGLGALFGGG